MTIDVSEVPDGACTPLDPEATTAREPRYQRAIDAIRAMLLGHLDVPARHRCDTHGRSLPDGRPCGVVAVRIPHAGM